MYWKEEEYFRKQWYEKLEVREGWILEISSGESIFYWSGVKLTEDIDYSYLYNDIKLAENASRILEKFVGIDSVVVKPAVSSLALNLKEYK